jgi:hypothetical protein
MSVVLHHSTANGTAKLVLLGIANHDGDGGAWPSIATLARYANVDPRTVQRAIGGLKLSGELDVVVQGGGGRALDDVFRPNLYRVKLRCPAGCSGGPRHVVGGDAHVTPPVTPVSPGGVTPTSPEPSLRTRLSVEQRSSVSPEGPARENRSPKYELPKGTDGHPKHGQHDNAAKFCARIRRERKLPIPSGELLGWCYRIGDGDPWAGHREVDRQTATVVEGARSPAAVFRARLRDAVPHHREDGPEWLEDLA